MADKQQGGATIERDANGRSDAQTDEMGGGAMSGGAQAGGGPGASDMASPGASSGIGGYGNDANTQWNQSQSAYGNSQDAGLSRGEAYDEAQGGGRAADSVSAAEDEQATAGEAEFARDQQQHQDRGQGSIGEE